MKTDGHARSQGAAPCSALELALRLLACGPKRGGDPIVWTEAAMDLTFHCRGTEDVTEAAMRIIADSREWHAKRTSMLAKEQKRMRDPERTLVCDILANGQLLPDANGSRYGMPNGEHSNTPTQNP